MDDDDASGSDDEDDDDEASGSDGEEEKEDNDEDGLSDDDDEDDAAARRRRAAAGRADDDDDGPALADGDFVCLEMKAAGLPREEGVPTEEELFANLKCQPGFRCTRAELADDLRTLMGLGLFEDVTADVEPLSRDEASRLSRRGQSKGGKAPRGGSRLVVRFDQKIWPRMESFECKGATVLPQSVVDRVMEEHAKTEGPSNMRTLALVKNVVEGWYQERGYPFSYIQTYDGMDTGKVVANVIEGRVSQVNLVFQDDNGNPVRGGGETDPAIVTRELPFKEGNLYSQDDARKALRDVFATNLFDNVQLAPRQSAKNERDIEVDVLLKERPSKSAEVEAEWQLAPTDRGIPAPVSFVPGGSVTFEHRNLQGCGNQLSASINTQNFLRPAEDLGFRLEYRVPFLRGPADPARASLGAQAFNARKQSPVFTAGPGGDGGEVPPVWVDRTGAKITLHEAHSRSSKSALSFVAQEIGTFDDQGQRVSRSAKQGRGGAAGGGAAPTTTLSPTGRDRTAFLQASLVRDATYFADGATVGPRDVLKVDQGLGLGPGAPFYNRWEASVTRHVRLPRPPAWLGLPGNALGAPSKTARVHKARGGRGRRSSSTGPQVPPPTLIVQCRAGHTTGDLPAYDAHPLGGPYSVRGYTHGELGAVRTFLETAVEVRAPLPWSRSLGYCFWERGTGLGSAGTVDGNPTEYFGKAGSGTGYGAGIKAGAVRAEWAVDANAGKGAWFVRFGERFGGA